LSVGKQTVIGAGKGARKKGKQDTTIQRRCFYHSTSFITEVTLRSKVVRPSSICFSFVWNTSNFDFISFLTVFLRPEINSMLLENKQLLEQAKEIEKRENKIRQSREDAAIIQHLETLNDDITKLSIVPLPVFPSVKYSRKCVELDRMSENSGFTFS
jgi:hypothetical protein